MYKTATKEKISCLIINLDKSGNERYRMNFQTILKLNKK
jgi:hypothetical protein